MSGSVTTARVAPTPAELERQARERARREQQRQIRARLEQTISAVRAVTVASARTSAERNEDAAGRHAAGARAEDRGLDRETARAHAAGRAEEREINLSPGRDVGEDRVATPRAGEQPDGFMRPDEPAAPDVTRPPDRPAPPAAVIRAADLRELALKLAAEAHREGFPALAEAAEEVHHAAQLLAVERALDDAIDAAKTEVLVEARVAAAAFAVLGVGWTAQPDEVGQRRVTARGDTLRSHVQVDNDGTAVVEIVVDARAPELNGLQSGTCSQENRITTAIFTEMASPELEVIEPPAVARRVATRLGGLVGEPTKRSARASRAREARPT